MIIKICKNIYTKTRIDKGIDKVNIKTWLCFIFLGIGFLIYKSFNKKETTIVLVNNYCILKNQTPYGLRTLFICQNMTRQSVKKIKK